MTTHDHRHLTRDLEHLAHLMDEALRIPGTHIRFGLDPVLGLIPGVGDTVSGAVGLYMIAKARGLGVPQRTQLRMLWNIGIDWLIGTVPLLGDLFDLGFKANRRNVELIKRHLEEQAASPRKEADYG